MPPGSIPVIDLTPFDHGDRSARRRVIKATAQACEEIGFFILTGHGVSPGTVQWLYQAARAFFDQPPPVKDQVGDSGDVRGGLMYFPFGGEHLAATGDGAKADEASLGDLKQSIDFGPGFWGDEWPAAPRGLQTAFHAYHASLTELSTRLRRLFMAAVGLREDFLDSAFDRHLSTIRVNDYPEQTTAPLPGQLRAGAHTDYGFLTILRSEDAPGGLQVQNRAGDWLDVPNIADTFVVNIGDAMMRWTNDRWISTPHRVVNPPPGSQGPTRRQSIAFFNNPNRDAVIECLPVFRSAGKPVKYQPVTYGDYAEARHKQAHGAHKSLSGKSNFRSNGLYRYESGRNFVAENW
jgi:isopenicillin N synthase-like dioxygenase